jgi:rubrerythrin
MLTSTIAGLAEEGARVGARPGGARHRWHLAQIDLSRVDARHRDDTALFYLLASASFIESGSELYTRNLLTYYQDNAQIAAWLREEWEGEELQHGAALRAYVQALWPQFDWVVAYRQFFAEYSLAASPDAFEATPYLELAARCMIETGTASLYQMLHSYAQEPVLRQILGHIRDDEVRHYKNFLKFVRTEQASGGRRRLAVATAIARRAREARSDDAWIAFRHAYEVRNPGLRCERRDFERWDREVKKIIRHHFPFRMAADMLVAPLALPVLLRRLIRQVTEVGLQRALCG